MLQLRRLAAFEQHQLIDPHWILQFGMLGGPIGMFAGARATG